MKTLPRSPKITSPRWILGALLAALVLSACVKPTSPDADSAGATEGTVSLHVSGD
jgi:hypothetical protein